jgi:hypothetical protein
MESVYSFQWVQFGPEAVEIPIFMAIGNQFRTNVVGYGEDSFCERTCIARPQKEDVALVPISMGKR